MSKSFDQWKSPVQLKAFTMEYMYLKSVKMVGITYFMFTRDKQRPIQFQLMSLQCVSIQIDLLKEFVDFVVIQTPQWNAIYIVWRTGHVPYDTLCVVRDNFKMPFIEKMKGGFYILIGSIDYPWVKDRETEIARLQYQNQKCGQNFCISMCRTGHCQK